MQSLHLLTQRDTRYVLTPFLLESDIYSLKFFSNVIVLVRMNTKVRYTVLLTLILFMAFIALHASIVSTEFYDEYIASTEPALQFFSSVTPLNNPNASHEKCNVFSCKNPEYVFDYNKWKKAQEAILEAQKKRLGSIKITSQEGILETQKKRLGSTKNTQQSKPKKHVCPPQIAVEDIEHETPEEAELNAEKDELENSILETQERLNEVEQEMNERKEEIQKEIISLLVTRDQLKNNKTPT